MAAWIMDEVRYWKGKEKIREKNAGSKDLLDQKEGQKMVDYRL